MHSGILVSWPDVMKAQEYVPSLIDPVIFLQDDIFMIICPQSLGDPLVIH